MCAQKNGFPILANCELDINAQVPAYRGKPEEWSLLQLINAYVTFWCPHTFGHMLCLEK